MSFSGKSAMADRGKARSSPMTPKRSPGQSIRRPEGDVQRKCSSPLFTRSPARPESDYKRPCMKPKALECKENGHSENFRSPPAFEKSSKASRVAAGVARQTVAASPKKILGEHNDILVTAKRCRKEWQIPATSALELKQSLSGAESSVEADCERVENGAVTFPVVCEAIAKAKQVEESYPASKKLPAAKKLFGTLEPHAVELEGRNTARQIFLSEEQQESEVRIDRQYTGPQHCSSQSSVALSEEAPSSTVLQEELHSTTAPLCPTTSQFDSVNSPWRPASEFFTAVPHQVSAELLTTPPARAATDLPKTPLTLKDAIEHEMALEQMEAAQVLPEDPVKTRTGRGFLRSLGRILLWSLILGVLVALAFQAASYLSRRDALHHICKYQVLLLPPDNWSSQSDMVGLYVDPHKLYRDTSSALRSVWEAKFVDPHKLYRDTSSALEAKYVDLHKLYRDTASTLVGIWETKVQPRVEELQMSAGILISHLWNQLQTAYDELSSRSVPAIQVAFCNSGVRLKQLFEVTVQYFSSLEGNGYLMDIEFMDVKQELEVLDEIPDTENQASAFENSDVQEDDASLLIEQHAADDDEQDADGMVTDVEGQDLARPDIEHQPAGNDKTDETVEQVVGSYVPEADTGLTTGEFSAETTAEQVNDGSESTTGLAADYEANAAQVNDGPESTTGLAADYEANAAQVNDGLELSTAFATDTSAEANPEQVNDGLELSTAFATDPMAEANAVATDPSAEANAEQVSRASNFLDLEDTVGTEGPKVNMYLVAASVAMGLGALGYHLYLLSKEPKPKQCKQTLDTTTLENMRLRGADEKLVFSPEQNMDSPYGSFTAFKQVVVNEGSNNEQITLTPVRRSNRIRNQLSSP